jgi:hypothetical protein
MQSLLGVKQRCCRNDRRRVRLRPNRDRVRPEPRPPSSIESTHCRAEKGSRWLGQPTLNAGHCVSCLNVGATFHPVARWQYQALAPDPRRLLAAFTRDDSERPPYLTGGRRCSSHWSLAGTVNRPFTSRCQSGARSQSGGRHCRGRGGRRSPPYTAADVHFMSEFKGFRSITKAIVMAGMGVLHGAGPSSPHALATGSSTRTRRGHAAMLRLARSATPCGSVPEGNEDGDGVEL